MPLKSFNPLTPKIKRFERFSKTQLQNGLKKQTKILFPTFFDFTFKFMFPQSGPDLATSGPGARQYYRHKKK